MSGEFKVGDRVRYIDPSSSTLTSGQTYTVSDIGRSMDGEQKIYLEGHGKVTFWYARRFELVATNQVTVSLTGEVVGRNADVVTIKTDDGTSVLVPASLVPEDPRLVALREVMTKFAKDAGWGMTACNFEKNVHDERLRKMLPEFIDAVTRAS